MAPKTTTSVAFLNGTKKYQLISDSSEEGMSSTIDFNDIEAQDVMNVDRMDNYFKTKIPELSIQYTSTYDN